MPAAPAPPAAPPAPEKPPDELLLELLELLLELLLVPKSDVSESRLERAPLRIVFNIRNTK